MSEKVKKYIPKWKLSKFYHDKYWAEVDLKRKLEEENQTEESEPIVLSPSQEITFPEDRKRRLPLGTTTMNYVLYENCCISYDEYINRKGNEVQP